MIKTNKTIKPNDDLHFKWETTISEFIRKERKIKIKQKTRSQNKMNTFLIDLRANIETNEHFGIFFLWARWIPSSKCTAPDESNYIQWCLEYGAINVYLVIAGLALFHIIIIIASYNGQAHNIIINIFLTVNPITMFEIIKMEKFLCICSRPPPDDR